MRLGSLFSGIGAFDLGFERAGFTCAWQVEIDKDCRRVLEKHWPGVKRYEDVSTVGKLEPVDVIAFGWPCQDLSVAGVRAGISGERSGLFFEAARIIQELRPKWIVAENVPGLFSSYTPISTPPSNMAVGSEWEVEEDSDFENVLATLDELGYCVSWRVCDAQFWNVAQRRERVFLVGSLGNLSSLEVFPFAESMPGDFETRREAGAGVTPILEAGARTNGDGHRDGDGIGVEGDPMFTLQRGNLQVTGTLNAGAHPGSYNRQDAYTNMLVANPLAFGRTSNHYDVSQQTYYESNTVTCPNCGETHIDKITDVLDARAVDVRNLRMQPVGTSGTLQHKQSGGHSLNYQNPILAFSSKDHGADAGEIAPTLRSQNFKDSHINGGGQVAIAFCADDYANMSFEEAAVSRPLTNSPDRSRAAPVTCNTLGVRRLTPRECERLQGFPDDWTLYDANGKEISDSARYRMLGNAVCVSVAEWIGRRLIAFKS